MEQLKTIFISYSWDSEEHKQWVLELANYLMKQGGCEVLLDQYDLKAGHNMNHFMESGVERADKVLLIMTPNYKMKADKREGGTGFEYSMISSQLYRMQANNNKFLPILRKGTIGSSAPTYIQSNIYHDMSDNSLFDTTAYELLRLIYEKPELVKPSVGSQPTFKKSEDTSFVTSANKIAREQKKQRELEELRTTEKGVELVMQYASKIFADVQKKAKEYNQQTEFDLTTELHENNNSLRINADKYYVNLQWNKGWGNSINNCNFNVNSGEDQYYQPNQSSNFMRNVFSGGNSQTFTAKINDEKNVLWMVDSQQFTTDAFVSFIFSVLLKTMTNV